mgnify:FL=1
MVSAYIRASLTSACTISAGKCHLSFRFMYPKPLCWYCKRTKTYSSAKLPYNSDVEDKHVRYAGVAVNEAGCGAECLFWALNYLQEWGSDVSWEDMTTIEVILTNLYPLAVDYLRNMHAYCHIVPRDHTTVTKGGISLLELASSLVTRYPKSLKSVLGRLDSSMFLLKLVDECFLSLNSRYIDYVDK